MTASDLSPPEAETAETSEESESKSPDTQASPEEPELLPLDIIFEILKNRRRRLVLNHVKQQEDQSVDLGSLAEHVAALENDKSVAALTSGERKRVYVGLYQCHLPKMDDAGIVDFDRNRGTIELGPNADQLEEYLDTGTDQEHPWPQYYLSITLIGAGLFLIGQAGLYPIGWLQPAVVLLMIVALSACAVAHARTLQE